MTTEKHDLTARLKELYLIPVPLSDDTVPAQVLPASVLEIVPTLKCFFVENLRSARRFLKAVDSSIDIDSIEFFIVDEHTTRQTASDLAEPLSRYERAGVISEAGCPAVADPGSLVVEMARSRGSRIIPLVGPSSIILGLMASGFNGQSFTFHGYLPYDTSARQRKIKEMVHNVVANNATQIFIETPYRNNRLIDELSRQLPGAVKLCVACNLTSPAEEVSVRPASQWRTARYDFSKRPAIFLLGN